MTAGDSQVPKNALQAVAANEDLVALIASFIDDQGERTLLAGVCQAWRRALRSAWHTCRLCITDCDWLLSTAAPVRLRSLHLHTPRREESNTGAYK